MSEQSGPYGCGESGLAAIIGGCSRLVCWFGPVATGGALLLGGPAPVQIRHRYRAKDNGSVALTPLAVRPHHVPRSVSPASCTQPEKPRFEGRLRTCGIAGPVHDGETDMF